MNFEEWWSNGTDVVNKTYVGLFADDNQFTDDVIIDQTGFNRFLACIALHVTERDILVNNNRDYFLNNTNTIDFEKECLVVIKAAVVDKVLYSDLFECYVVYLTDESTDHQSYCAVICRKIEGLRGVFRLSIMGKKPEAKYTRRLRVMNEEY
jgi:hypothetical protein